MIIRKIFFFIFMILFSRVVQADKELLDKKVQYKGLNRIPISIISKFSKLNSGSLVSNNKVENFVKKLSSTNNFVKIILEKHKNSVFLNFIERPIVSKIEIISNKLNNNKNLKKILKNLKIERGKLFNKINIDILKKKIKNGFFKIGRFDNLIHVSSFLTRSNKIHLKIYVNQGNFYQLKTVKVIGCKKVSINKIKSFFLKDRKPSFLNLFRDHYFHPKKLQQDLKKIKDYYLSLGFSDFSVRFIKVHICKKFKTIHVLVSFNEGKQYFLEKVLIEGNILNNIFEEDKKKYISLNSFFNFSRLEKLRKIILKKYHNLGYEHSNVCIYPIFDKKNKKVRVRIKINPKKRYFVHRIYFKGNKYTKDSILRNQIDILEGDIFRKKFFYNSIKKIKDTQFFDDVNVKYKLLSGNKSNQVDLIYFVKEKNTGTLNFNSGYGMETGISLNFSMSDKNWLGTGKEYKINTFSNDNKIYEDLSFVYPYFNSYNTIFSNLIFHDRIKGDYSELFRYTDENYGMHSDLNFNVNNNKFNFCFSYIHNVLTDIKNHISVMKYLSSLKSFTTNGYKHIYQKIDDFIIEYKWENFNSVPTRLALKSNFLTSKHKMILSGKFTLPGSDNSFYKILLDDYESVSVNRRENFKLSLRSHIGFGNTFFGKREMPFYENFYAGGSHSVRGFILNSVGPKSIYYNKENISCMGTHRNDICKYDKYIGGNGMIVTNMDLFLPNKLFFKTIKDKFRSSIFLDSGVVWDSNWQHNLELDSSEFFDFSNPNIIYASSGISYSWFSSLGKISISYAFPIGKYDSYKIERLQINIGNIE